MATPKVMPAIQTMTTTASPTILQTTAHEEGCQLGVNTELRRPCQFHRLGPDGCKDDVEDNDMDNDGVDNDEDLCPRSSYQPPRPHGFRTKSPMSTAMDVETPMRIRTTTATDSRTPATTAPRL